jgi:hypothetical protein
MEILIGLKSTKISHQVSRSQSGADDRSRSSGLWTTGGSAGFGWWVLIRQIVKAVGPSKKKDSTERIEDLPTELDGWMWKFANCKPCAHAKEHSHPVVDDILWAWRAWCPQINRMGQSPLPLTSNASDRWPSASPRMAFWSDPLKGTLLTLHWPQRMLQPQCCTPWNTHGNGKLTSKKIFQEVILVLFRLLQIAISEKWLWTAYFLGCYEQIWLARSWQTCWNSSRLPHPPTWTCVSGVLGALGQLCPCSPGSSLCLW